MAKFVDTKRIGSGGFGEVWLYTRESDRGTFAKKKLLDGEDEDGIARFQRNRTPEPFADYGCVAGLS